MFMLNVLAGKDSRKGKVSFMNRFYPWIIGILAGVIIIMILFDKPEPYDSSAWKEAIQRSNDKIATLQVERTKLARKIAEDSILRAEERHTFQNAIGSLKTRLQQKRVRIDTLILESPALRDYVATADSVMQLQAARIDTLEVSLDELQINMKAVNVNCDQMLEAERDKFKDSEEFISDLEKQVKRSKRGNRRLTAGIIVSAVAGLFLGTGL